MSLRIAIRTDAGIAIGFGHAMRMLALAQAVMDQGGRVLLCTAELPATIREQFLSEAVQVRDIEADAGSVDDAAAVLREVEAFNATWIVVDGYQFRSSYFDGLRTRRHPVLYMDDTGAAATYAVDIILNQNLHATRLLYRARPPHPMLLLGPRYALLRRSFLAASLVERRVNEQPTHLLVTLGGSDPANITSLVVNSLCRFEFPLPTVHVLLGGGYSNDTLWIANAEETGLKLMVYRDHHDIPGLMRTMDVAISAAGSTMLELAYLGVPTLALITAENQRDSARAFKSRGAAMIVTHDHSESIIKALRRMLTDPKLRMRITRQARALVDGFGARRTVEVLTTAS